MTKNKLSNQIKLFVTLSGLLLPATALAAADLLGVVDSLIFILQSAIPILIGIAVVMFLFGLIRYMTVTDDSKRKEAISVIVYGIVTLFVMVAMWGLVYLLSRTLGISVDGGPALYYNPINL